MLKRWRDLQAPDKRRVRSIVFTTLVGKCVPTWARGRSSTRPDADVVCLTLKRLDRYLQSRTRVPLVRNPSLLSENLARDWTAASFGRFRAEVAKALADAEVARSGRSGSAWRAVFGDSFPS
jgi:hypothetical protein